MLYRLLHASVLFQVSERVEQGELQVFKSAFNAGSKHNLITLQIKAECPLCKQPFKTIIHNVRSLGDYDRYPVQSSTPEHSALSFHIVNIRRQRYSNQGVLTNDIDAAATDDSLDGLLPQPTRMQAPFNRFEPYRTELLNFYRHDQDAGGSGSLSQLWRRYVYDRKLYALPVSDSLTGQFREWSARFYR